MMALKIDSDRDAVVFAFPSRGQFLPLPILWPGAGLPGEVDQAEAVANAIYAKAAEAEDWVKSGGRRRFVTGVRRVGVQVRDLKVLVVFETPITTERIPFESARALADEILKARIELLGVVQRLAGVKYAEDHPELQP